MRRNTHRPVGYELRETKLHGRGAFRPTIQVGVLATGRCRRLPNDRVNPRNRVRLFWIYITRENRIIRPGLLRKLELLFNARHIGLLFMAYIASIEAPNILLQLTENKIASRGQRIASVRIRHDKLRRIEYRIPMLPVARLGSSGIGGNIFCAFDRKPTPWVRDYRVPSSISRKLRRMIFPVEVFGTSSTNCTARGTL